MRQLFNRVGNDPGLFDSRKAVGTGANVRFEGRNAKTLLVIDEEVDLGREKVTVIHEWVYAQAMEWVSESSDCFFRGTSEQTLVRLLTIGRSDMIALTLGLEMLQRAPELVPGPVDVGFHGAEWKVECRRYLLVGTPFDVTQQYAGSILGTQLGDCLLDRRAKLLGLELIEG